jgi:hypothetical protein
MAARVTEAASLDGDDFAAADEFSVPDELRSWPGIVFGIVRNFNDALRMVTSDVSEPTRIYASVSAQYFGIDRSVACGLTGRTR